MKQLTPFAESLHFKWFKYILIEHILHVLLIAEHS